MYFSELAERTNATQLAALCRHFLRNHAGAIEAMAVDSSQGGGGDDAMSPSR